VLLRTLPAPVPPSLPRRLHGVRLAGPDRPVLAGPLRVQRRVSTRAVTQVDGLTASDADADVARATRIWRERRVTVLEQLRGYPCVRRDGGW
jgi:hypothetical protein